MTSADARTGNTISFVVPCYNERENVAGTVAEIERGVRESSVSKFEIVIVDDCSSDGTSEVAHQLMSRMSQLKLVINEKNLGFGGAYKEGVRHATMEYLIMVPGDNSYPSSGLAEILREAGKADIIVPYREGGDVRPWYRSGPSIMFTGVMNFLFRLDLPYYNAPVLHRTRLLKQIEIRTSGFAYGAEALVKLIRRGATYSTVGIAINERNQGRSSALKPANLIRVFGAIMSLWVSECIPFWRKPPQLTK